MLQAMFSGVSGLQVHQTKLDVIGNNIANVNTVGFKAGTVTPGVTGDGVEPLKFQVVMQVFTGGFEEVFKHERHREQTWTGVE